MLYFHALIVFNTNKKRFLSRITIWFYFLNFLARKCKCDLLKNPSPFWVFSSFLIVIDCACLMKDWGIRKSVSSRIRCKRETQRENSQDREKPWESQRLQRYMTFKKSSTLLYMCPESRNCTLIAEHVHC